MIRYFTKILLTLLLFSAVAYSQEGTGSISGTVLDSAKSPQPDVNVKIKGGYNGTATDIDGKYTLKNVNPGEYTIQVSAIGFKTVEYTGIKVKKDEITTLDIVLKTTSFYVGEEIMVVGERPLLYL